MGHLLLIIALATAGKFGGTFVAGRMVGMPGRFAAQLGILMNTRGLMELVVLNVGLDLGVISPTLFTMMVIMALVTTAMTTPLLALVRRAKARWTSRSLGGGWRDRQSLKSAASSSSTPKVAATPAPTPIATVLPGDDPLSSVTRVSRSSGISTGASGTRVFFCTRMDCGVALISVPRNDVPSVCSTRTLLPGRQPLHVVGEHGACPESGAPRRRLCESAVRLPTRSPSWRVRRKPRRRRSAQHDHLL